MDVRCRRAAHFRAVDGSDGRAALRLETGQATCRSVDLQLMVFFYPRRAENRTFRPPVTQKQKNSLNFKKG
jgi:hypothetical protein